MLNLNSFRLSESQVLQKIITGSNAGNVCTIHSKYHTCILPILKMHIVYKHHDFINPFDWEHLLGLKTTV